MTDWVKYLKVNSPDLNCWTFVEHIQTSLKVWNLELQELYSKNKHKWGHHITFDDIERVAKANNGIKVDIKDLQPHDVLVFGVNDTRPLHFGLYIGRNQFIHFKKMPKIDDLDDTWRSKLKIIYRETR